MTHLVSIQTLSCCLLMVRTRLIVFLEDFIQYGLLVPNAVVSWYHSELGRVEKFTVCVMNMHAVSLCFIHYRQKLWNIFHFGDFLHFCGAWRVFLSLKCIPKSRYYFLGDNGQLTAKWTAKGENYDFGLFSVLDFVYNSCRLIVWCLPYPIVCCFEIGHTIPLFICCLLLCDHQEISVVGALRSRKFGVGLAYHKVMSTKPYPVTNNRYFHTE